MLVPSFQEAKGRSWKATAEQLLHVNGHGQDFTVVKSFFKTEGARPSSEAKVDFNAQTPFANPRWFEVGVLALGGGSCLAKQTEPLSNCMHITHGQPHVAPASSLMNIQRALLRIVPLWWGLGSTVHTHTPCQ